MIWDSGNGKLSLNTSNLTSTKWKIAVTHEIGHALGHEGHTRKNSIMTTYLEEAVDEKIYTPTSDDLQQMLQVY